MPSRSRRTYERELHAEVARAEAVRAQAPVAHELRDALVEALERQIGPDLRSRLEGLALCMDMYAARGFEPSPAEANVIRALIEEIRS